MGVGVVPLIPRSPSLSVGFCACSTKGQFFQIQALLSTLTMDVNRTTLLVHDITVRSSANPPLLYCLPLSFGESFFAVYASLAAALHHWCAVVVRACR